MKLTSITLKGFKSIDSQVGAHLTFGDVTILLGANGAGKSNIVSFFDMLNYAMTGALQVYIAEHGFATSFLHFGPKQTPQISGEIAFEDDSVKDLYQFTLTHAAGDSLIYTNESIVYQKINQNKSFQIQFSPGVKESDIIQYKSNQNLNEPAKITTSILLNLIKSCKVFHFHDTSIGAKIRNQVYLNDNNYLRSDAGNLASFLYSLKEDNTKIKYYEKIERYIKKAMPQFGGFSLFPDGRNNSYITLNWFEANRPSDILGPHQISDGSLRFMALTALFLQPPTMMPKVIIVDEPELGLHPAAISYLAGMVKSASKTAQVIISTQSPQLIEEFDLENIIVVERKAGSNSSTFERKSSDSLSEWVEEYSLGEIWAKNIIGGQP